MNGTTAAPSRLLGVPLACALVIAAVAWPSRAEGRTAWAAADVRVNDPATQFEGPNKNIREPIVAIDPTDPSTMIAFAIDLSTLNFDPGMYGTNRAFRSTDGGATWTDMGPIPYTADPSVVTYSGDPVAAFGPDGVAYFASLGNVQTGDGGAVEGIFVHRSADGGANWELPVLAVADTEDPEADTCSGTDKEWLSVDPRTGRLYLAYTLFSSDKCSSYGDPIGLHYYTGFSDIGIFLVTSDDGGATWSPPQKIWRGYALGAIPRVAPDGTLYVAFWTTVEVPRSVCPTAIGMVPARAGGSPFAGIVVARSTDDGETWDFHHEGTCGVEPELLKPGAFVGGTIVPAMSVDPSTSVAYVTWPAYSPLDRRYATKVITSADGGESWSAPVELIHGEEHSLMPAIHADAGVARLVYLTVTPGETGYLMGSPGAHGDTYVVESTDGGLTWSAPVRLSSMSADYSGNASARAADVGDYIGIDLSGGRIAAIWTDARQGDPTEIRVRTGSVL